MTESSKNQDEAIRKEFEEAQALIAQENLLIKKDSTENGFPNGTVIYRVDLKQGIVKTEVNNYGYGLPWVSVKGVVGALTYGESCHKDPQEAKKLGAALKDKRLAELEMELQQLKNLSLEEIK